MVEDAIRYPLAFMVSDYEMLVSMTAALRSWPTQSYRIVDIQAGPSSFPPPVDPSHWLSIIGLGGEQIAKATQTLSAAGQRDTLTLCLEDDGAVSVDVSAVEPADTAEMAAYVESLVDDLRPPRPDRPRTVRFHEDLKLTGNGTMTVDDGLRLTDEVEARVITMKAQAATVTPGQMTVDQPAPAPVDVNFFGDVVNSNVIVAQGESLSQHRIDSTIEGLEVEALAPLLESIIAALDRSPGALVPDDDRSARAECDTALAQLKSPHPSRSTVRKSLTVIGAIFGVAASATTLWDQFGTHITDWIVRLAS